MISKKMLNPAIKKRILRQLGQLAVDKQRQVLAYAEMLNKSGLEGNSGRDYLRFAGIVSVQDASKMQHVIKEGCGRINENDW